MVGKNSCFTVDYDPSKSFNRPMPLVPDSRRNEDTQLGRPTFTFKKTPGIIVL